MDKVHRLHQLSDEYQNKSKVDKILGMSARQIGRYLEIPME